MGLVNFIGIVLICMFFVTIFLAFYLNFKGHIKQINEKVMNIGGELIKINSKLLRAGPFVAVMKTTTVYEFVYLLNGEEKIGYVKFGILTTEWKLE